MTTFRSLSMSAFLVLTFLVLAAACSDSGDEEPTPLDPKAAPALAIDDSLAIDVVIPVDAGTGLSDAAQDMLDAFAQIAGVESDAEPIKSSLLASTQPGVVMVQLLDEDDESELGEQDYTLKTGVIEPDAHVLTVTARTEVGAMYGLYHILTDLGVLYYHPEESFFPSNSSATLPWKYDGSIQTPHFLRRGFHEHTQHPILMSDALLRPGNDKFRQYVSNYIRWMARNRQNFMSWQMLKTVDLDEWLPYITDIIEEAHAHGVGVSMFISYVDQQQNMFKLIDEESDTSSLDQITGGLDRLLAAGFDYLGFQIGSSEFTKPDDAEMLSWMDVTLTHLEDNYPDVIPYAWIHTTCDLEAEDGGYYFHLPLKADGGFGAFVHTTMFYDLDHPAPVYSCDNFHQQVDFMDGANGKREMVYFPETAWWLGFDNNCPVVLPITGYTRAYDIDETLNGYDVAGHVTFTSGREWTYWMYDHFLTQKTWNADLSWDDYLSWISPIYGEYGGKVKSAMVDWTDLQVSNFLEEYPEIYFYLAGELRQDEIGEVAGILARRPKLAFQKVLDFSDQEFADWQNKDMAMLQQMLIDYQTVLDTLPEALESGSTQQKDMYTEVRTALYVFVKRIEHTITVYEGVSQARAWVVEKRRAAAADPVEEPDEGIKTAAMNAATQKLNAARDISGKMVEIFGEMESLYRYPVELLAREKPETKTAYPFGYLEQTSSGHFWTRRDDQLEDLIGVVFDTSVEEWDDTPQALYLSTPDSTSMTVPDDPLAGSVITSFLPQLLFGMHGYSNESDNFGLILAQDFNANLLPDPGTEQLIMGELNGTTWTGSDSSYIVNVHDSSGLLMGELLMLSPEFTIEVETGGEKPVFKTGTLSGDVQSAMLVALVMNVGGIDEEGTKNIIKSIYGIDSSEPLPASLPTAFAFEFVPAN